MSKNGPTHIINAWRHQKNETVPISFLQILIGLLLFPMETSLIEALIVCKNERTIPFIQPTSNLLEK